MFTMDNDEYKELIEHLSGRKKLENPQQRIEKYCIKNGQLFRKGKRVIPRYELEAVMYLVHDNPLSGHLGIEKCYEKIKERFYWKGMMEDVKRYIRICDQCQRRGKPKGRNELHSIRVKEP